MFRVKYRMLYTAISLAQVLWEEERRERGLAEKQTFVDLGCGNGLLVHLLTVAGVRYTTFAK